MHANFSYPATIFVCIAVSIPLCLGAQADCETCHADEARLHRMSRHSGAIQPILQSAFFKNLPGGPIGESRDGYLLTYSVEGSKLQVTATRGKARASALIEWVFGNGQQGETPIAVDNSGETIEHRISYYAKAGRYDLTLGHKPGSSSSAEKALGIRQDTRTAVACFSCHSVVSNNAISIPGVQCEHCHEGAAQHAQRNGAVTNPGKLAARQASEICAKCHRSAAPGAADDPLNIRFQPLRLAKSRCFAGGQMSCSTCHEAHRDARRSDAAYYQAKCVGCHQKPHRTDDCLPCHMPRSSPTTYLTFTDHYIRKPGGR